MNDVYVIQRALAQLVRGERAPAELLGVEPRVLSGLYAVGLDARARGRHGLADNVFQRCVLLDPFCAHFWIALAATRQALGRPEEAAEMYQVAGLMTPDLAPVAYAAACFAEAGQFERARVLADYVREQLPDASALEPWLAVAEARAVRQAVSS